MSKRIIKNSVILLLLVLVNVNFSWAGTDPDVVFDIKTDKRVENVYFIGDKGENILVTNRANNYVYDAETGKMKWYDKTKDYIEDGLQLIWNEKYLVVSLKKGMKCYEVATGKVVWETEISIKMKDYSGYFNFKSGFVMSFGSKLMGFNPNTGEISWQSDKLDWDSGIAKQGGNNIYSFNRDYGGRLLVLGGKVTQLLDAATGEIIGTVEMKYIDKNPDHVVEIGNNSAVLFGKNMSKSIDLRDGKILWEAEEQIDYRRGFVTMYYQGKYYAVFAFKKKMLLYDLDTGEMVWEKGEEVATELETVHLYPDGTLLLVGIRNQSYSDMKAGSKNPGSFTKAYGFDFLTGEEKYQSVIGYTSGQTIWMTVPIIGITIGYRSSVCQVYPEFPGGVLMYFYAGDAKKLGEYGEKWKDNGNEGLVLMDPETGEIKWRNDYILYDNWRKDLEKAQPLIDPGKPPSAGIENYRTPPLKIEGNYAFMNANNKLVKVDLSTGEEIWASPEYGTISDYYVDKGRVFGKIGYSKWSFSYDLKKLKSDDQITTSKDQGCFVLDTESGMEVWNAEKVKTPLDLFLNYYNDNGKLFLCDGEYLRCLNIMDGGYDWELNLKKQLNGEISAKDGVAFILTSVSSHTSYGYYYNTITTEKTYDVSMQFGVFPQTDGNLLVIAEKGPALVGQDGKIKWKSEWKWNGKKVNFVPTVTPRGIVYQYKKNLQYISIKDGSVIWESKEKNASGADIFFSKNYDKIFIVEKKNITCYKL